MVNPLTLLQVYLSGPVGSDVKGASERFLDAVASLMTLGWRHDLIFNPVTYCMLDNETRWLHCMSSVLDYLHKMPDYAVFCRLQGWENSPGARIENMVAKQRGLVIVDLIGRQVKLADDFLSA